jgi:hypothetical protein
VLFSRLTQNNFAYSATGHKHVTALEIIDTLEKQMSFL